MRSYNGFTPSQRYKALDFHKKEIKAGRKPAKPNHCDGCGQTKGILTWHSEDYSEPFGDHIGKHGVCYVCHMMIHCRFRNRPAWEAHKQKVKDGFCPPAMTRSDFTRFVDVYLNNWSATEYEIPEGKKSGFIFGLS